MRVVWKYALEAADELAIPVPRPGLILLVGAEEGRLSPTIWVEVDPTPGAPRRMLELSIRGTGRRIPPAGVYRGSAICGPFVWHVFERIAP